METSLFIARLMGPILVVTGFAALINPRLLEEVGRDVMASRSMLFLAGILALVAGLAIVNTHNIWVIGWPVVITIFGYLAIAGGIVRTAFPGITIRIGETMLASRPLLMVSAVGQVALGLWLSWAGYI